MADCFASAKNTFNCLIGQLTGPATAALTHDVLEEMLVQQGRELLRLLLQAHLDLRAERERRAAVRSRHDAGAAVAGTDGVARRRLETGHHRLLSTLVGTVTVTRCAWRAAGAPNVYPADAALSLPAGRHSQGLARLAVCEAVRGSFDAAKAAIVSRCGPVIGKRQLEEAVVAGAADIDAFYARRIVLPRTPEELLVISVDGKGVVMRPEGLRSDTRKAAERRRRTFRTRLASGEKPCRKRMATLGVVYDAAPAPRRPHDVIAVPGGRSGDRPARPGPKARGKWLCASVSADPGEVIAKVFDQAEARDPLHARTWVVLIDGARHQMDLIHTEAGRRGVRINVVIDVIHVLEYLWKAAWCLHAGGDPAAEDWVATHALSVLAGRVEDAAAVIDAQATTAGLARDRRGGVDAAIRYLRGNAAFLRYDEALAAGWPIATGVIEGACRHLVNDRLDITGARWGLAGAEAILTLRAVIANGDFDAYWRFHLAQDHRRVHQARYQEELDLTA
ncbi:ISKra4 family transposase [Planomonospora sp. ID82291]|nr:ISKra4 family transposase [Planomonospora sp. ID82291]MBG0814646.1 ISKra4 family transposase [Planomonospora sp. ID82291]